MCAVDNCEPWEFVETTNPRARIPHKCVECCRVIQPGEHYHRTEGCYEGRFSTYKVCKHCHALGDYMFVLCGGHPFTELLSELIDHWHEGYKSVLVARWIACMKHRWHDGRDSVPERSHAEATEITRRVDRSFMTPRST